MKKKSEKMGLAMGWIEKKWKKIVTKNNSEKSEKMGQAMGWIEKKWKKIVTKKVKIVEKGAGWEL